MLKRTIFVSLLICLLLPFGSIYVKAQNNNQSLLWKITRADLKKPSYLFGTIHLICKDDYIWTPPMQKSLDASDKVCFEMDLDDPNLMMTIAAGMIDNSGKQLKDYFTPEQYTKLAAYITDSLQMNIVLVQRMKPVALYTLFSTDPNICDETVSYEMILTEKAKRSDKEILGIEDAKEQLSILDQIPEDTIVLDIVSMLDGNNDSSRALYDTMYHAYKRQDLNTLSSLITESKMTGSYTDLFLDDRNQRWIPRMMDMMEQGSIFFAVGAGHLSGDNGIINLLIKEGYTVTPIK